MTMQNDTFEALAERALELVKFQLGGLTSEQIAEANDIRARFERLRRETANTGT